jgi:hypothetical protein
MKIKRLRCCFFENTLCLYSFYFSSDISRLYWRTLFPPWKQYLPTYSMMQSFFDFSQSHLRHILTLFFIFSFLNAAI